jgi:hypothetical protein
MVKRTLGLSCALGNSRMTLEKPLMPRKPKPSPDPSKESAERQAEAEREVRLSDTDVAILRRQAIESIRETVGPPHGDPGATSEQVAQWEADERERSEQAVAAFRKAVLQREIDAYIRGVDNTIDQEAKRAYNTRSIVLLLVVLAVVSMPVVAIFLNLSPEDFGSYIAPVTGIAGTVVGYWFGAKEST